MIPPQRFEIPSIRSEVGGPGSVIVLIQTSVLSSDCQCKSSQDQSDQLLHWNRDGGRAYPGSSLYDRWGWWWRAAMRNIILTLSGLLFNLSSSEFAPVSYIPEELLEIFHVNINVANFVFGGQ